MLTTRDDVVRVLRGQGQHDRAALATCCLSASVDTDRDAMRLRELGISEQMLRAGAH